MHDNIELPLLDKKKQSFEIKINKKQTCTTDNSSLRDALNPEDSDREFKKIDSCFKYMTYLDMLPLSKAINATQKSIKTENLPVPYNFMNVGKKAYLLDKAWYDDRSKSPNNTRETSLMRHLLKIHKWMLLLNFFYYFIYATAHLCSSMFLGKIIGIMTSSSFEDADDAFDSLQVYTVIFLFACLGVVFFGSWWPLMNFTFACSARLSITGFIYKKLNTVALSSLHEISLGKVINIIANDLHDIDSGMLYVSPFFAVPYTLLLSLYILWGYFGVYSLLSLGLQSVILTSAIFLSNFSKSPRNEKNRITDQRIKYTNEFIENIRLIKLYAWEKPLTKMLLELRNQETKTLKKLAQIDSISMMFTESGTFISVLITCIAYVYFEDGVLSAEKVFAATLVLNFSKVWVNYCVHKGLGFFVNMRMMNQRLEDILRVKDVINLNASNKSNSNYGDDLNYQFNQNIGSVAFDNFRAYWNSNSPTPCLKDITTTINKGELVAIIGKIGSGKTTFLLSFLREIPITSGQLLFNGSFAYVEQEPVIFSGSVRDNILFGQEYEESFYSRVLKACNLDEDLKQFDHGDQTIIGERGVTLSGGQKARISLARALFARSDIYLLDDPLSAVDSRVGRIIFERAIKDILKEKTVLLVTHHLNYAKEADRVIVMKDGGIEGEGKFDDLMNKEIDLLQILAQKDANDKRSEEQTTDAAQRDSRRSHNFDRKTSSFIEEAIVLNEKKQDIQEEESTVTNINTYKRYVKESKNYLLAFFTLGCFIISQLCVFGFTQFIGYWAQSQSQAQSSLQGSETDSINVDNYYYFTTLALFTISIVACNFGKTFLTNRFLLETNSNLHKLMLHKISRTFVSFYDATPVGVVLNRFSNDLGVLDKSNYMAVYDIIDQGSLILIFVIYLCYRWPVIIIIGVIMSYGLFQIKKFFTKPTIELRKLDLVSKSPIYSEISSTLNGLLAIRVYQQGYRYVKQFSDLIYNSTKVYSAYIRNNRLFALVLESSLYLLSLTYIFIFMIIFYMDGIEVAIFGQALFYLMLVADESSWAVRQIIFLDINMQSAQRIQQYFALPEEPATENEEVDSKLRSSSHNNQKSWPFEGQISFRNVYLKYPSTDKYALSGLTFSVTPNTKVGIVGRTGAGKSSIIQALFRIVEIEDLKDSHIEIDGVNIKTLGLEMLRSSLSILPQTPVIFSGTIRRNLDPFGKASEEKLWDALDQVNLKTYVKSLENGLDTDMSMSSSVFSAGQKQLVCLARVILRRSKVVILDEATANVDMSTDNIIQEKMNEIFRGCVVLTIAHRLITIANYDKILVMDKGRMVEYDHPYKLLVERVGDTRITKDEGVFVKMVRKCGEKASKEIFSKAYLAFMSMKN